MTDEQSDIKTLASLSPFKFQPSVPTSVGIPIGASSIFREAYKQWDNGKKTGHKDRFRETYDNLQLALQYWEKLRPQFNSTDQEIQDKLRATIEPREELRQNALAQIEYLRALNYDARNYRANGVNAIGLTQTQADTLDTSLLAMRRNLELGGELVQYRSYTTINAYLENAKASKNQALSVTTPKFPSSISELKAASDNIKKDFQKAVGLKEDGIVGRATSKAYAVYIATLLSDPNKDENAALKAAESSVKKDMADKSKPGEGQKSAGISATNVPLAVNEMSQDAGKTV